MEMKLSKIINFALNRDWGFSTISFWYKDTSKGLKERQTRQRKGMAFMAYTYIAKNKDSQLKNPTTALLH